jgi:hypothetical protein
MNRFGVLTVLFLLCSPSFSQTADTSGTTHSSPAPDLSQYRLKEVIFEGGRSFSAKRLYDTFHVPVGGKLDHIAAAQGLERLRELYGDYG